MRESTLADSSEVRAVLSWLRERKDTDDEWLVIVDNADDMSWGLQEFMPKGKRGSIIITSRDSLSTMLVDGGCKRLDVDVMSALEARSLILQHLHRDIELAPRLMLESCDAVVHQLGRLALAVDLAGAYVSNEADQEAALTQYITDYDKNRDALLQLDHFRGLRSHKKTIWTVWDTTFQKLNALEADQRNVHPSFLLSFLARFKGNIIQHEMFRLASHGIHRIENELDDKDERFPDILCQLLQLDNEGWDSFSYRHTLDILVRYNLIRHTEGGWPGVSMHSLVRWRALQYQTANRWEWWHLLFVLSVYFEWWEAHADPALYRHLKAHLPVATELYQVKDVISEKFYGFACWRIGKFYSDEGYSAVAVELFEQAVDCMRRVHEPEHQMTLLAIYDLGYAYMRLGRFSEAENLGWLVANSWEQAFKQNEPREIGGIDLLAQVYIDQGRWKEAEDRTRREVETRKKVLGPDHPNTLDSIQELASIYEKQGRLEEAERLHVKVVEIAEKTLGRRDPTVLTHKLNLAFTYWRQQRLEEAEEIQVEVAKIRKERLGQDHPWTLLSMNILGRTYLSQGRLKEAEELMVQVAEACQKVFGQGHQYTLGALSLLADIFEIQERGGEAEELMSNVLDYERLLGRDRPDTLSAMDRLACILWNNGEAHKAVALMKDCVDGRKQVLGPAHPKTKAAENVLKLWRQAMQIASLLS